MTHAAGFRPATSGRCVLFPLGCLLMLTAASASGDIHINEVAMTDVSPQWVELYNATDEPASLEGYVLTTGLPNDGDNGNGNDSFQYSFPEDMPEVSPGAFVLIYFDGAGPGANEFFFDDDDNLTLAILHSGPEMIDPFEMLAGHMALYSSEEFAPTTIVSFVAWGQPPGVAAQNAANAQIWPDEGTVVNIIIVDADESGLEGPVDILHPGGSIGLGPGAELPTFRDWVAYEPSSISPGAPNPLSSPVLYLPADQIQVESSIRQFSWAPMLDEPKYHFQFSSDQDFLDLLVDESDIADHVYDMNVQWPDGTYYWRVRAIGGQGDSAGPFSATSQLIVGYPENDEVVAALAQPDFDARPPAFRGRGGNEIGPTFTVSGWISDSVSNNRLSDVSVSLGPGLNATTNNLGQWAIGNVPPGPYTVSITLANYQPLTVQINVVGDTNVGGLSIAGTVKVIGVVALAARKDTALLCLDGDGHSCLRVSANNAWDGSHAGLARWGRHEQMYCTPTAAVMIARHYGGTVTRDEVAYEIWRDLTASPAGFRPEGDLGHGRGHTEAQGIRALRFALGATDAQLNLRHGDANRPTNEEMVALIDADRPLRVSMSGRGWHAMVVDGYRWVDKRLQVQFLNTDNNGRTEWQFWRGPGAWPTHVWSAAPNAGLTGRATDPRVTTDSDRDGIMDFDEDLRFPTDKNNADSDFDKICDKVEIMSYTFPEPARRIVIDNINRPENNPDSDGDGCEDGEEDLNRDGEFQADAGETDPYKADAANARAAGDLNNDCKIDMADFTIFLNAFGSQAGDPNWLAKADYNQNGVIDLHDFQIWLEYYHLYNAPVDCGNPPPPAPLTTRGVSHGPSAR